MEDWQEKKECAILLRLRYENTWVTKISQDSLIASRTPPSMIDVNLLKLSEKKGKQDSKQKTRRAEGQANKLTDRQPDRLTDQVTSEQATQVYIATAGEVHKEASRQTAGWGWCLGGYILQLVKWHPRRPSQLVWKCCLPYSYSMPSWTMLAGLSTQRMKQTATEVLDLNRKQRKRQQLHVIHIQERRRRRHLKNDNAKKNNINQCCPPPEHDRTRTQAK